MDLTATDIKNVLDSLPKKDDVDTLLSTVKGIDARLADLGKPQEEKKEDPEPEEAKMEAKGWFDDIMSFEFQGVPIGQAALGGFAAIFASELVDGFMANAEKWQRGLVKLGIAWLAGTWGKRILGNTGGKAVALLLTFDAIRDFSPIDSWADQLAEKISGTVTTAGLAGNQSRGRETPANPKGGNNSYYAAALGGGG